MKIVIDRKLKIELLNSIRRGYLDTENIEALKGMIKTGRPLSMTEIKEMIEELEREY